MSKRSRAGGPSATARALISALAAIGGKNTRLVFCDVVELLALTLANTASHSRRDEFAGRYRRLLSTYHRDDHEALLAIGETLTKLITSPTRDLSNGPDVLGHIFMMTESGNEALGQFFTPFDVSLLMVNMTLGNAVIPEDGFLTLLEPACGSGGMALAAAIVLKGRRIDPREHLHITARDIDRNAVHMTFVQLALNGLPAIVVLGDTLRGEVRERWFTPAHAAGNWSERLVARGDNALIAYSHDEKPGQLGLFPAA